MSSSMDASRACGQMRRRPRAGAGFFHKNWLPIVDAITPAIRDYLDYEDRLFQKCAEGQYSYIIEAGCADGRLLMMTALRNGMNYLGVDLVRRAINLAHRRIRRYSPSSQLATVHCDDIRNISAIAVQYSVPDAAEMSVLAAFPFNSFGNVQEPKALLKELAVCHFDILVFTYTDTAVSTNARQEYYEHCGLEGSFVKDDEGIHFKVGDSFISAVYRPFVLTSWLEEFGYKVTIQEFGDIGIAYHGQLPSSPSLE
jgi:hypothetical protein